MGLFDKIKEVFQGNDNSSNDNQQAQFSQAAPQSQPSRGLGGRPAASQSSSYSTSKYSDRVNSGKAKSNALYKTLLEKSRSSAESRYKKATQWLSDAQYALDSPDTMDYDAARADKEKAEKEYEEAKAEYEKVLHDIESSQEANQFTYQAFKDTAAKGQQYPYNRGIVPTVFDYAAQNLPANDQTRTTGVIPAPQISAGVKDEKSVSSAGLFPEAGFQDPNKLDHAKISPEKQQEFSTQVKLYRAQGLSDKDILRKEKDNDIFLEWFETQPKQEAQAQGQSPLRENPLAGALSMLGISNGNGYDKSWGEPRVGDNGVITNDRREELISQLFTNDDPYAGYATDEVSAANMGTDKRRQQILEELEKIDTALGNGPMYYGADRVTGAVTGEAAKIVSNIPVSGMKSVTTPLTAIEDVLETLNLTPAQHRAYDFATKKLQEFSPTGKLTVGDKWTNAQWNSLSDEERADLARYGIDSLDKFNHELSEANYFINSGEAFKQYYGEREDELREDVKGVREWGTEQQEKALNGTAGVERFLLENLPSAVGMAFDAYVGRLGAGGLEVMAHRVFGGSYQDALDKGASKETALVYGLLDMAKEVGTEMIGGESILNKAVYGNSGMFNSAMENAIAKIGKPTLQKIALYGFGAGSEGIEEIMGQAADPLVQAILDTDDYWAAVAKEYGEQTAKDYLLAGLGGALMSIAGSGVIDAASAATTGTTQTSNQLYNILSNARIEDSPRLTQAYEAYIAQGMSEGEAKAAALRETSGNNRAFDGMNPMRKDNNISDAEKITILDGMKDGPEKSIAIEFMKHRTEADIEAERNAFEDVAIELLNAKTGQVLIDGNNNVVGEVLAVTDQGIAFQVDGQPVVVTTFNGDGLLDPNTTLYSYLMGNGEIIDAADVEAYQNAVQYESNLGTRTAPTMNPNVEQTDSGTGTPINQQVEIAQTTEAQGQTAQSAPSPMKPASMEETDSGTGSSEQAVQERLKKLQQARQALVENGIGEDALSTVDAEIAKAVAEISSGADNVYAEAQKAPSSVNQSSDEETDRDIGTSKYRRMMTLLENDTDSKENTTTVGRESFIRDSDEDSLSNIQGAKENYELGGERFSAEDVSRMTAEDVLYRLKAWAKKLGFNGIKGFSERFNTLLTGINEMSGKDASRETRLIVGDSGRVLRNKDFQNRNNMDRDVYEQSQTKESLDKEREDAAYMFLQTQDFDAPLSDVINRLSKMFSSGKDNAAKFIVENIFKKRGIDINNSTVEDGINALAPQTVVNDEAATGSINEEDTEEIFALLDRAKDISVKFGKGAYHTLSEILNGAVEISESNDSNFSEKDFHGESSRGEDIRAIDEDIANLEEEIDNLQKQAPSKETQDTIEELENQLDKLQQQKSRYEAEQKADAESNDKTVRKALEETDYESVLKEDERAEKIAENERGKKPELGSVSRNNKPFIAKSEISSDLESKGNFKFLRGIKVNGETYYALSSQERGFGRNIIPDDDVKAANRVLEWFNSEIERVQNAINNYLEIGRNKELSGSQATALSSAENTLLNLQQKLDRIQNDGYTLQDLWNDKSMPKELASIWPRNEDIRNRSILAIANAVTESDARAGIASMLNEGTNNTLDSISDDYANRPYELLSPKQAERTEHAENEQRRKERLNEKEQGGNNGRDGQILRDGSAIYTAQRHLVPGSVNSGNSSLSNHDRFEDGSRETSARKYASQLSKDKAEQHQKETNQPLIDAINNVANEYTGDAKDFLNYIKDKIKATEIAGTQLSEQNKSSKRIFVDQSGNEELVYVFNTLSKEDAYKSDPRIKTLVTGAQKYSNNKKKVRIVFCKNNVVFNRKAKEAFSTSGYNYTDSNGNYVIIATDYETAKHELNHIAVNKLIEDRYFSLINSGLSVKEATKTAKSQISNDLLRDIKISFGELNEAGIDEYFDDYLDIAKKLYGENFEGIGVEMFVELAALTEPGTFSGWCNETTNTKNGRFAYYSSVAKQLYDKSPTFKNLTEYIQKESTKIAALEKAFHGDDAGYNARKVAAGPTPKGSEIGIIEYANPNETFNDFKDYPQGKRWMTDSERAEVEQAVNELHESMDEPVVGQTVSPDNLNTLSYAVEHAKQVSGFTTMNTVWDDNKEHYAYNQVKELKEKVGKQRSILQTPKLVPESYGNEKQIKAAGQRRANVIRLINDAINGNGSVTAVFQYGQTMRDVRGTGQYFTPEVMYALQNAAIAEAEAYAEGNPNSNRMQDFRYTAANALAQLHRQMENVDRIERTTRASLDALATKYGKGQAKTLTGAVKQWLDSMQIDGGNFWRMMGGYDKAARNNAGYALQRAHDKAIATQITTMAEAKNYFANVKDAKGFKDFANGKAMASKGVPVVQFDKNSGEWKQTASVNISLLQAVKLKLTMDTLRAQSPERLESLTGFAIRDAKGNDSFIDIPGNQDTQIRTDFINNLYESVSKDIEANEAASQYMKAAVDMFANFSPKLQAEAMKVNGYLKEMFAKGQYVPIQYSSKDGHKSRDWELVSDLRQGLNYERIMQNRTRSYGGYAVINEISKTVDSYISQASNYIAFADIGNQLNILSNKASMSGGYGDVVRGKFGDTYGRFFDNYVLSMNMIRQQDPSGSGMEKLAKARQLMMQGALVGSLSVPIKQVSSYFSSMGVLDPRAVIAAYRGPLRRNTSGIDNLFMLSRMQGSIDPDVSQALANGWVDKMRRSSKFGALIANATNIMDARTVANVYRAAILDVEYNSGLSKAQLYKNGHDAKDGLKPMGEFLVNSKFEEAVLNTQPIFTPQARNELARTENQLLRMFSTFRTQQTQNYNRLLTTIGEYRAARKSGNSILEAQTAKELTNTISGQVIASASLAALTMVADMLLHKHKKYKDDDDEFDEGKMLERFALNTIESAGGTYLFGDAITKHLVDIARGNTGNNASNKEFYGISMGAISSVESMIKAWTWLASDLKAGGKHAASDARYVVNYTGTVLGVPVQNAYNIVNSFYQFGRDIAGKDSDYEDIMKQWDAYRTDYGNQLFNAMREGKEDKAERTVEKMGDKVKTIIQNSAIEQLANGASDEEIIQALANYAGFYETDARDWVREAHMQVDTGLKFNNMHNDWKEGKITSEEAIKYQQRYGGKSKADAEKTVNGWETGVDSLEKYGIEYGKMSTAYINGKLPRDTYLKAIMEYGNKTKEEAEKTVYGADFKAKYGVSYDTGFKSLVRERKISDSEAVKWRMRCSGVKESTARNYVEKQHFLEMIGYEGDYTTYDDIGDTWATKEKMGLQNFYEQYGSRFKSPKAFGKLFQDIKDTGDSGNYPRYTYTYSGQEQVVGAEKSAVISVLNKAIANGSISYDTAHEIWTKHYGWSDYPTGAWRNVRK